MPPRAYPGDPADAVARLKAAAPIYRELKHPNLTRFVRAEEVGGGYAALFDWADVICMSKMYPSDHEKFMCLPAEARLRIFEDILDFHVHVAASGYVAVDFYDGSILWDTENHRTILCDIDYYAKRPYINRMGRMWGSDRFMSPEEYTAGAEIDEVTNVYTMGATAFALFADSDRTREAWTLNAARYDVAARAVSDERNRRQQSIRQLAEEWRAAGAR